MNSYGEQYKQLLIKLYTVKVKQASYKPHVINKRAALRLMRNPRLRYLLYKRAGFWGGLGNLASTAFSLTPIGMIATKKGRGILGKGLSAIGGLYGAGAKGLGTVGSSIAKGVGAIGNFGANAAGWLYGGALKGLGNLTGSSTISGLGDSVQSGFSSLGNMYSNGLNSIGDSISGAGNYIGNALSGGTQAAGNTNNSANSSGSSSGVINDSAEG